MPPAAFLPSDELRTLAARNRVSRASSPGRHAGLTLAGCQDFEYSYDGYFLGRPNGVFSYVALDALKALPEDATYQQWHDAIRRKLPSRQYPQTPNLYGPLPMKKLRIFS